MRVRGAGVQQEQPLLHMWAVFLASYREEMRDCITGIKSCVAARASCCCTAGCTAHRTCCKRLVAWHSHVTWPCCSAVAAATGFAPQAGSSAALYITLQQMHMQTLRVTRCWHPCCTCCCCWWCCYCFHACCRCIFANVKPDNG